MKKVCHVTNRHNRYDTRIFQHMCVSLAKNNYDVTLLCIDGKDDEVRYGVKIVSDTINYKNKYDRIFNSKKKLINSISKVDADIYHLHDADLLPVIPYLKKMGKKVIFDSHEDHPTRIKERRKLTPLGLFIRYNMYVSLEKRMLKKCDAVISVTPHIVERLKKINKNCYMITNYPLLMNNFSKDKFDNYICFAGGIANFYNHHNIIEAINNIDNLQYYLAGDINNDYGNGLKDIKGYEKVKCLGKISYEEVLDLYKNASIGMCLLSPRPNTDFWNGTLGNTKLYEFMASGLPIIATKFKLWEEIIKKYNCGICVDPTNVSEIKEAIIKIMYDDKLRKTMSNNSLKAAKTEFNWNTQEKILLDLYKFL